MKRPLCFLLIIIFLLAAAPFSSQASQISAIETPVLKWQYGGCYTTWCETGWYSSPVAIDLDKDTQVEVIAGAYSIFILNGSSGSNHQSPIAPPTSVRIWSDIALADLDGDKDWEFVAAYNNGYLRAYDAAGSPMWTVISTPSNELRSLAIYDIDGNGDQEIVTASTRDFDQFWVFEHTGSVYSGSWPQHNPDSSTNGYTAGAFNENLAVADLTGDGLAEIIASNDTHYLAALHSDGSQVMANSIFGTTSGGSNKYWSLVGVNVDQAADIRGWTDCATEHRPNFANSAPIINDLDNNGILEVIVVGNIYDCSGEYIDLYEMPFIFTADRTRWAAGGYDWTIIPAPDGDSAPLSEDYTIIENNMPNPAIADLDGDRKKEIVYPSYDGRMHAYWLDKTEHGNFPFSAYNPSDGYITFASEPAIADLDNNGQAEIIFTTWVQKSATANGKLIILSSTGDLLQSVNLPAPRGTGITWNGASAAPTLANIDSDADLEVVINTKNSGVVAYDLPNTANARILWGTGRGNYLRSGSPVLIKVFLPFIKK